MDAEEEDNRSMLGAASTLGDDDDDHESPQRDCIGSLVGRPARSLQSRASFLNGRPPYLLYFWVVADTHQLLQSLLHRLSNSVSASDASCAPSTTTDSMVGSSRAHKRRHDVTDESSLLPLVQSIKELAECQRQLVAIRSR